MISAKLMAKASKVIASCQTFRQCMVAQKYIDLLCKCELTHQSDILGIQVLFGQLHIQQENVLRRAAV